MAKIDKVQEVAIDKLKPYSRNAKTHSEAQIEKIAASIEEFGFISPCLIDADYNIIAGHGRVKAAQRLGMKKIPCVFIEGLTEEQYKAYILTDNRLTELGDWDMDIVMSELEELNKFNFDIDLTGFQLKEDNDWFKTRAKWDDGEQDGNEEYNEFLNKFQHKKNTDDCYTPDNVYDVVADWVSSEYDLDRVNFVRPFYPGGDYQAYHYKANDIVVDNPPFSILAEICRWYITHNIKFFLFAPNLTLLASCSDEPTVCNISAYVAVTFENGAEVNIGFKTNLESGIILRTAPALTKAIAEANRKNIGKNGTPRLQYVYPPNVVTAAKVGRWGLYGIEYKLPSVSCKFIYGLESMSGKGIFGGGLLLNTAETAKAIQYAENAEKMKVVRATQIASEIGIPPESINAEGEVVWQLSDAERECINELDKKEVSVNGEDDIARTSE